MWLVILAGVLWGVTNPYLKKFTAGFADDKREEGLLGDIKFLCSRPKYLIAQGLNLAGSVAFAVGMADTDLMTGPAVANAINMVLTCVVSAVALQEEPMTRRVACGVALVFGGVMLCVTAGAPSSERVVTAAPAV